jgi:hypothetical protein
VRMRSGMLRAGAAALAVLAAAPLPARADGPVTITADLLPSFRVGHPEETRFGALEFVGGFEVSSDDPDVSGLSSLVVDPGGGGLLAISDDGWMLRAAITRDAAGRPTGFQSAAMHRVKLEGGRALQYKWEADTEAIDVAVRDGEPLVAIAFEGAPRVMTAPVVAEGFAGPLTPIALPKGAGQVRFTKGFEALALAPASGPLAGAMVIIAERAERGADTDDQPGWIVGGPDPGRFRIKAKGDFDVTEAKFAPDGDLYVLERLYSLAEGVRARIRRIPAASVVKGATVDGPAVFEADLSHQIDNMEGMAFWQDAEGRTMVSLLSDDNSSILQRTLYLEFRLAE